MKIVIVGCGYVGLANGVMLAEHHRVDMVDINKKKVDMINCLKNPIADEMISSFFEEKELDIQAHLSGEDVYSAADWVILALPTNYDETLGRFCTDVLDRTIEEVRRYNRSAVIVIKSTVPIGYTQSQYERDPERKILFSPEFLREGKALYDCLHPSRIIVGVPMQEKEDAGQKYQELQDKAQKFAELLGQSVQGAEKKTMLTLAGEGEAIKLFSNSYLAMRVAFFNEIDTFSKVRGYSAARIIEGVCADGRIGAFYNNPSFGYGGYCLPKDTCQLMADFAGIPGNLIRAVIKSNKIRKDFIVQDLANTGAETVGIYRLIMKADSDNFRQSSILDILLGLKEAGKSLLIYEPNLKEAEFMGCEVVWHLDEFKRRSDIIAANRLEPCLEDVKEKVYSRDIYRRD